MAAQGSTRPTVAPLSQATCCAAPLLRPRLRPPDSRPSPHQLETTVFPAPATTCSSHVLSTRLIPTCFVPGRRRLEQRLEQEQATGGTCSGLDLLVSLCRQETRSSSFEPDWTTITGATPSRRSMRAPTSVRALLRLNRTHRMWRRGGPPFRGTCITVVTSRLPERPPFRVRYLHPLGQSSSRMVSAATKKVGAAPPAPAPRMGSNQGLRLPRGNRRSPAAERTRRREQAATGRQGERLSSRHKQNLSLDLDDVLALQMDRRMRHPLDRHSRRLPLLVSWPPPRASILSLPAVLRRSRPRD